jgi:formylglycine-generating enzyme required for sulfatase activity
MPHLFISYSRVDLTFVERLAVDLKSAGFDVWYDVSNLGGGSRWNKAIEQAIRDSQYVIVILSSDSVASQWVDDEVSFARTLKKKIVPLYYRPCDLGLMYVNLNWIDIQGGKYKINFDKVLNALDVKFSITPKSVSPVSETKSVIKLPSDPLPEKITPEWIFKNKITLSNGMEFMRVPAGEFIMGSNNGIRDETKPQHTVNLPYDYWMGRYPVTNMQYNQFKKKFFGKGKGKGKENYPVVNVSWNDAMEYCRWLSNLLKAELPAKMDLCLPTEAEWEKAARGTDGREYPWGNTFDKNKCNSSEGGKGGTTPIGLYSPQGDSPYGCADMAGNVWEWSHSLVQPYPYKVDDGRENEKGVGSRILRSGSYIVGASIVCCAIRLGGPPDGVTNHLGFRISIVSSMLLS